MAGLTPEEEAAWIADTFQDGEQMDIDKLANSDAVQKLLAQPELTEVGTYRFGDVDIRYKPALTSQLRVLLAKAQKEMQSASNPLQVQDKLVYDALAEICLDADYKNPVFWQLVDLRSKDGRVYRIFKDLMEKIGAGETSTRAFRGKP
jgi:hypothetical protein